MGLENLQSIYSDINSNYVNTKSSLIPHLSEYSQLDINTGINSYETAIDNSMLLNKYLNQGTHLDTEEPAGEAVLEDTSGFVTNFNTPGFTWPNDVIGDSLFIGKESSFDPTPINSQGFAFKFQPVGLGYTFQMSHPEIAGISTEEVSGIIPDPLERYLPEDFLNLAGQANLVYLSDGIGAGQTLAINGGLNLHGPVPDLFKKIGLGNLTEFNFSRDILPNIFSPAMLKYDATVFELTEGMVADRSKGVPLNADATPAPAPPGIPNFDNPYRGIAFQVLGPVNNPGGVDGPYPNELKMGTLLNQFKQIPSPLMGGVSDMLGTTQPSIELLASTLPGFTTPSLLTPSQNIKYTDVKMDYSYQDRVVNRISAEFHNPIDIERWGGLKVGLGGLFAGMDLSSPGIKGMLGITSSMGMKLKQMMMDIDLKGNMPQLPKVNLNLGVPIPFLKVDWGRIPQWMADSMPNMPDLSGIVPNMPNAWDWIATNFDPHLPGPGDLKGVVDLFKDVGGQTWNAVSGMAGDLGSLAKQGGKGLIDISSMGINFAHDKFSSWHNPYAHWKPFKDMSGGEWWDPNEFFDLFRGWEFGGGEWIDNPWRGFKPLGFLKNIGVPNTKGWGQPLFSWMGEQYTATAGWTKTKLDQFKNFTAASWEATKVFGHDIAKAAEKAGRVLIKSFIGDEEVNGSWAKWFKQLKIGKVADAASSLLEQINPFEGAFDNIGFDWLKNMKPGEVISDNILWGMQKISNGWDVFKNGMSKVKDFIVNLIPGAPTMSPDWSWLKNFGAKVRATTLSILGDLGAAGSAVLNMFKASANWAGGGLLKIGKGALNIGKKMISGIGKFIGEIDIDFGWLKPKSMPSLTFSGGKWGFLKPTVKGMLSGIVKGAVKIAGALDMDMGKLNSTLGGIAGHLGLDLPAFKLSNPLNIKQTEYGGTAYYKTLEGIRPTGLNQPRNLERSIDMKMGHPVAGKGSYVVTKTHRTPYQDLGNDRYFATPQSVKDGKIPTLKSFGYPNMPTDPHKGGDQFTNMGIMPGDSIEAAYGTAGKKIIESENTGMPFYFKDLRDNTYIILRGYLEGITENVSPTWTSENYIGRSEPVWIYERAERDVSFTLKLFAQTASELDMIYGKLNKLTSLCYPEYKSDGSLGGKRRMKSPYVALRMGELYGNADFDQTGFIKSINYIVPETATWEYKKGKRVPKLITSTINYQIVHRMPPDFATSFYGKGMDIGHA